MRTFLVLLILVKLCIYSDRTLPISLLVFCQVKSQEERNEIERTSFSERAINVIWSGIYSQFLIQFCSVSAKLSDKGM